MANIWFLPLTEDAGSMAPTDANIMEHGSLFQELTVKV
jgi:hypothetical protein